MNEVSKFKRIVETHQEFIKELDKYTNDEITGMIQWTDPQVAYVVGYVKGWKSTGPLYDR